MMMDAKVSSTVPPGFRFHPTEEELVGYYLRKKMASQSIDFDVIRDIDLYRIEPWEIQDKCGIGYEDQKEWYFFSRKYKKYPTGTRMNRATIAGFWKATGRDKAVYDNDNSNIIGMRKTLVFYKGRAPNGQKTDWVMREYKLDSSQNNYHCSISHEEEWVLCRAFKKRIGSCRRKSDEDDDQFEHLSHHHHQPPPLESGVNSPPPPTPPESCDNNNNKVMNDWRALDKFVASQLCHENDYYCYNF